MNGQVEVVIKSRKPWPPDHQSGAAKGRSWRRLEMVNFGRQNGNTRNERGKKRPQLPCLITVTLYK